MFDFDIVLHNKTIQEKSFDRVWFLEDPRKGKKKPKNSIFFFLMFHSKIVKRKKIRKNRKKKDVNFLKVKEMLESIKW